MNDRREAEFAYEKATTAGRLGGFLRCSIHTVCPGSPVGLRQAQSVTGTVPAGRRGRRESSGPPSGGHVRAIKQQAGGRKCKPTDIWLAVICMALDAVDVDKIVQKNVQTPGIAHTVQRSVLSNLHETECSWMQRRHKIEQEEQNAGGCRSSIIQQTRKALMTRGFEH